MVKNVFNHAMTGIDRGFDKLADHAHGVATSVTQDGGQTQDLTQHMVGTTLTKNQIEAAVKLLKTADETLGHLLNIKV